MGGVYRNLRSDREVLGQRLEQGTVRRVLGFARPHRRLISVFLTLMVVDAGLVVITPLLTKWVVDDGILLLKYWLTVDQAQQEERFAERRADPLKRWKLSPVDLEARAKYADYSRARDTMLEATHTKYAPWTLVDFNDQRRGRLALIRHLLDHVPDRKVPENLLEFPPLDHEPLKDRPKKPFKPI